MNLFQSFTEFEALQESLRDADVRMLLPSLEIPRWSIHHLEIGSIHIQVGSEGSGNIAEGSTSRNGWFFYNQTSGTWGSANGQRMRSDSTVIVPPGSEFCFACPQGKHNWYSVFVPSSVLFATPGEVESIRSVENDRSRFRICRLRYIQDLVERLQAVVMVEPAVLKTPSSVTAFQEEIRSTAIHHFSLGLEEPLQTEQPRKEVARMAVDLIDDDQDCSLTVATLAKRCNISERSLRNSFYQWFGISPLQYLTLRRLHSARRVLRSSCPDEVRIGQVGIAHGFWDLGRFAGRYRKLFGERPSETLRKPMGRN